MKDTERLEVRLWSLYLISNFIFSFEILLSSGESSEANCYDDIDAAYNFLTEKMQMKPENIVLYGRSLGSGPSCYLAERLQKENIQIGGIILQVIVIILSMRNSTHMKYKNNLIQIIVLKTWKWQITCLHPVYIPTYMRTYIEYAYYVLFGHMKKINNTVHAIIKA